MPSRKVSSRACSGVSPRSVKNCAMSGERLFQVRLLVKPSNETVPIITSTIATVPGSCSSRGSPESGGRRPTSPSRVSNTDSRENRLK